MPIHHKRLPVGRRRRISEKSINDALHRTFELDAFRPGQELVIRSVLAGEHTLAILPTGAGKSLCYQLPALLLPGRTVVVSPLIALMTDQCDKLRDLGFEASAVHSGLTSRESRDVPTRIAARGTEFILTTPEQLANGTLLSHLDRVHVDLLVIDEAHCISQWGHDFRPAYLALKQAFEQLGSPTVLALTATATTDVIADIERQLDLQLRVIQQPLYRPNLHYTVVQATTAADKEQALWGLLDEEGGAAIVYCATVRQVDRLVAAARARGTAVVGYHGKMRAADRGNEPGAVHGRHRPDGHRHQRVRHGHRQG